MATIVFYEKPGCKGNARQKALLVAAGHTVRAKNLKAEPWTKARLLEFLSPLPVSEWFNRSAPAVQSGEIVPETLSANGALILLLANPLLIRRPLLEVAGVRYVGFDAAVIETWIGLNGVAVPADIGGCQHGVTESHGEGSHHGSCGDV